MELEISPSICLHPGLSVCSADFANLDYDDIPFVVAAVKFAIGEGSIDDVIAEARELEALRQWRESRDRNEQIEDE